MPDMISEDLMSVPEIAEAIELSKMSAYTRAELDAYDKYWDQIRLEKTYIADAEAKGEARGEAKGEAKGKIEVVKNCYRKGFDINTISEITSLSKEDIEKILLDIKK